MIQGLDPIRRINEAEVMRTEPAERSAAEFMKNPNLPNVIHDVLREAEMGRRQGPLDVKIRHAQYTPKSTEDARANMDKLASNAMYKGDYKIKFNPNIDEAILAHELGHVASRHGGFGKLVRDLRDNPDLTNALALSGVGAGALYAGLNEGNDDIDEAVAINILAASPTLLDEGLASMKGLDIMNKAGSRASLGQRGKLAGGYLSYLAPAIAMGLGSASLGNVFDD